MRHKCMNFIESERCIKCNRPEWSLYYPEIFFKKGDRVTVPQHYTAIAKDDVMVLKKERNGYVLCYVDDKEDIISWFDWWELYPLNTEEQK